MDMREYLETIATTFDRSAGMGSQAQQLLRRAPAELAALTPVGFIVTGSGGAGNPATIPWFGFLDPDETTSPLEGLYVVYLFAANLEQSFLTLIQGITRLHERLRLVSQRDHEREAFRAIDDSEFRNHAKTDQQLRLGQEDICLASDAEDMILAIFEHERAQRA